LKYLNAGGCSGLKVTTSTTQPAALDALLAMTICQLRVPSTPRVARCLKRRQQRCPHRRAPVRTPKFLRPRLKLAQERTTHPQQTPIRSRRRMRKLRKPRSWRQRTNPPTTTLQSSSKPQPGRNSWFNGALRAPLPSQHS
jgi:hypothetical protein